MIYLFYQTLSLVSSSSVNNETFLLSFFLAFILRYKPMDIPTTNKTMHIVITTAYHFNPEESPPSKIIEISRLA